MGHYAYYGISLNFLGISEFYELVKAVCGFHISFCIRFFSQSILNVSQRYSKTSLTKAVSALHT